LAVTNLRQRLITSLLLIPVVILATWFDKPVSWLTIGAVIWGGLALFEFYRLVRNSNLQLQPLRVFGITWGMVLVASPHLTGFVSPATIITAGIILSLIWLLFNPQKESAFSAWAWTVAGVMYVGLLLSYLVALRLLPDGAGWVFLALFSTFASDSAAFFAGSLCGKHKLAPNISPHKTWEGAAGGMAGGMLLAPLVAMVFHLPISWMEAVILGLLVSAFGQMGDLAESLFKRNMKAKDSGKSIPGHGGCLDRMDSVVFASIVVYYYVLWLV